jgi:hypothetical protein
MQELEKALAEAQGVRSSLSPGTDASNGDLPSMLEPEQDQMYDFTAFDWLATLDTTVLNTADAQVSKYSRIYVHDYDLSKTHMSV